MNIWVHVSSDEHCRWVCLIHRSWFNTLVLAITIRQEVAVDIFFVEESGSISIAAILHCRPEANWHCLGVEHWQSVLGDRDWDTGVSSFCNGGSSHSRRRNSEYK